MIKYTVIIEEVVGLPGIRTYDVPREQVRRKLSPASGHRPHSRPSPHKLFSIPNLEKEH